MTNEIDGAQEELFCAQASLSEAPRECRYVTVPGRGEGPQDVLSTLSEPLKHALSVLFSASGLEILNRVAVNEYWLVQVACEAALTFDDALLGAEAVVEAADSIRDGFERPDVLHVVNTQWQEPEVDEFDIMAELAVASDEGVIVRDPSHPRDGAEFINPIFFGGRIA